MIIAKKDSIINDLNFVNTNKEIQLSAAKNDANNRKSESQFVTKQLAMCNEDKIVAQKKADKEMNRKKGWRATAIGSFVCMLGLAVVIATTN